MLKFLTHKLRTHSLNEDQPHHDKVGCLDYVIKLSFFPVTFLEGHTRGLAGWLARPKMAAVSCWNLEQRAPYYSVLF